LQWEHTDDRSPMTMTDVEAPGALYPVKK